MNPTHVHLLLVAVMTAMSVWSALNLWLQGSVFASWRDYLETSNHSFIRRLSSCRLCLTPWLTTAVLTPFMTSLLFWEEEVVCNVAVAVLLSPFTIGVVQLIDHWANPTLSRNLHGHQDEKDEHNF